MFLVSVLSSRFAGRGLRTAKSGFAVLFVFISSVITIASQPVASALAATPTVTAPSKTSFTNSAANQEPGDFVITHFGASDTLLVSVGLIGPPTGTTFVLPTSTGLTAGYGYNFTGNKTQISFTGTQADANTALAAMTVTTGSNSGDVEIRVAASVSTENLYFNPINGHYYEFVSAPLTTDCKQGADASCITNIEDAIAPKTLYGAQGYWAAITSKQENSFIANNMNAPNIAIGLSDREEEGTWRWLYGPEKGAHTFFNWAENEPNNYNPCEEDDQACIPGEDYVVTNWQGAVGFWNDYGRPRFEDELSYIVEYSADCYSLTNGDCVSGAFSSSSQASATVTSTVGWGFARPAEFSEGILLHSPQEMYTSSVSCSSPGNCAAVGQFKNGNGGYEAFTMTSTNDVWARARPAVFDTGIQSNSPNAFLYSVSCSSPGDCTAVGQFKNVYDTMQAFTMTSTNGAWDTARPAQFNTGDQNASPNDSFFSVSCTSPGNCTAVGSFLNSSAGYEAFTMTSTNDVWARARPTVFLAGVQSTSLNAVFNSVSCSSPGNCTTVGMFKNSDGGFEGMTMTSQNGNWDTARPAVVSAIQDEAKYGMFNSVSCASPGNCIAAGLVRNSSNTNEAFTMTSVNGEWDTAQPAVFPISEQFVSRSGFFTSVSCASPGNCTAVGKFMDATGENQAFTMSLANGAWDLARPAQFNTDFRNTAPDDGLESVSCATPGNCTAAGYFMNNNGSKTPFTYTSTNGVWGNAEPTEFSDGIRSTTGNAMFNSVSCSAPGNCTALGDFPDTQGGRKAFTATSSKQTSPPPDEGWDYARPAEFPNGLFGYSEIVVSSVSCASRGNCTVVGGFQHIIYMQGFQAFTMTSTNGVWAPVRAALFPDDVQARPDARFNWVSCASPGNCTAAGSFNNSLGANEAFTMTSTNGVWGLARPAEFAEGVQSDSPDASFASVSCASPGNCTAVGKFKTFDASREAFTMTSTNGVWAPAQPAQFPEDSQHESRTGTFNSVSCASAGNCTAVGHFNNSLGANEAFTMTSTNGVWATARPAQFPEDSQHESRTGTFNSVSCASAGNCTAVGHFKNSDGFLEAFTMSMADGGVWTPARPAEFAEDVQSDSPNATFSSVSCASPGNCTAVGEFANRINGYEAFTMTSINGVFEAARAAEFPAGTQNETRSGLLNSVSCATAGNCTAVGRFVSSIGIVVAFTMTSTNGVWELARPAAFASGVQSDFPPTTFSSVSCASPGNCTAAGDFVLSTAGAGAVFTMSSATKPAATPSTPDAEPATTVPSPTTTSVPLVTTTVPPTTATEPTTTVSSAAAAVSATRAKQGIDMLPQTGTGSTPLHYAIWVLIAGLTITDRRKLRQK